MSRLPSVKPREVIRALEKGGFTLKRIRGSHYILKNDSTSRTISVPYHNRNMKKGTLRRIIKESGLTREEFLKLL